MSKAQQVCDIYYKTKCGQCPIRQVCVRTVGYGQEALDKWVRECEEAAEKVLQ